MNWKQFCKMSGEIDGNQKAKEAAEAKARLKKFTDLRPTLNPDIGGRRIKPTPTLDQYDRARDE